MRVIVVDDESIAAVERLKFELRKLRIMYISTFTSATKALEHLRKGYRYEIAFLDIRMPEMSGLELAQQINALNLDIFIVFVTAYSDYALEAFKIGATDYILKSYSSEE